MEWITVYLSSLVKFILCLLVVVSFFVVYFWEPRVKKREENQERNNGVLNYVEVDADDYTVNASALRPPKRPKRFSGSDVTLAHLGEYVRALKENRVRNIDEV